MKTKNKKTNITNSCGSQGCDARKLVLPYGTKNRQPKKFKSTIKN